MGGPGGLSAAEVDALAAVVAEAMPVVVARVPLAPAAVLGRRGAAEPAAVRRPAHLPPESRVVTALHSVGALLAERLLGALEITVDQLSVDVPPGLAASLAPPPGPRNIAVASSNGQSEAARAAALADRLRPGCADLVADLVDAVAAHPAVAAQLDIGTDPDVSADAVRGEEVVAARHGAAHLALAVLVATAVLRAVADPIPLVEPSAAVVGLALGAAALLLSRRPMPASYAEAVLAKRRAEYRYPQRSSGATPVSDHWFALAEGPPPDTVDFSGNGLVAVFEGGVAVRTGVADGHVQVLLDVLDHPPTADDPHIDDRSWDEVVEVSWTASRGGALLPGSAPPHPALWRAETPPWPGDYRVRVHANGRDGDDRESYHLVVWAAPPAPEVVRKRTDRLGHRLRGEPEPPVVVPPHAEHRWIADSWLSEAATITVVTGLTAAEVLRAFGADPDAPVSLAEVLADMSDAVAVRDTGGAVLAVENNGFRGSDRAVLAALSRNGRAASVFWNVNAVSRLSFARDGALVAAFEPGPWQELGGPELAALLDDLDFTDYRHRKAKGLTAVARFTGHGMSRDDLAAIEAADTAYRLGPPRRTAATPEERNLRNLRGRARRLGRVLPTPPASTAD